MLTSIFFKGVWKKPPTIGFGASQNFHENSTSGCSIQFGFRFSPNIHPSIFFCRSVRLCVLWPMAWISSCWTHPQIYGIPGHCWNERLGRHFRTAYSSQIIATSDEDTPKGGDCKGNPLISGNLGWWINYYNLARMIDRKGIRKGCKVWKTRWLKCSTKWGRLIAFWRSTMYVQTIGLLLKNPTSSTFWAMKKNLVG